MEEQFIYLDGFTLTCEQLMKIGYENYKVKLTDDAWERVRKGREVVQEIVDSQSVVYGINTGFGNFATVTVQPHELAQLQANLIRSHSAGIGTPLPVERARMLLGLRINVLAKGHSGIRPETLTQLIDALNANCISAIPEKGTVGASGDLAPLSHMALGMMGEGKMWNPTTEKYEDAALVLEQHNLKPIHLEAKEGLALINGTQFMTSLGVEAVQRAINVCRQADIVAALTLESLQGTVKAFDQRIHAARPQNGQMLVAKRMRALLLEEPDSERLAKDENLQSLIKNPQLIYQHHHPGAHESGNSSAETDATVHAHIQASNDRTTTTMDVESSSLCAASGLSTPVKSKTKVRLPSEIYQSHSNCNRVQDAYTLRCIPQVHGIANDTVAWVKGLIETELNCGTDNPMIFADPNSQSDIYGFSDRIVSGGNFHGEYPAKALDFLAIGVHELANISERRIDRLLNPNLSGLPPFLVRSGGLNSGFMIAHCTASALTSENKVLVHPASSDTLTTSASKEDHVSMGGFSARKALTIVENVEHVLAIELLCACQAIEFVRPLKSTKALEAVHALVRSKVAPYDHDRYMAPDIEAAHALIKEGKVWETALQALPDQSDLL